MASPETFYRIKRIDFLGRNGVPIFLQNLNGPCPLLSISNILSLRNQLPPDVVSEHAKEVSIEKLLVVVADRILNANTGAASSQDANLNANIHDCLEVLNKLGTGIDVNVRFNSATGFEFTKEVAIFDLLGIPLVHGWLVDPQARETARIFGNKTYNQAVEMMIAGLDAAPTTTTPSKQPAAAPVPAADSPQLSPAAAAAVGGNGEMDLLGLDDESAPSAAPAAAPAAPGPMPAAASTNHDLIAALDSLMEGLPTSVSSMPVQPVAGDVDVHEPSTDLPAPAASAPAALDADGLEQRVCASQPEGNAAAVGGDMDTLGKAAATEMPPPASSEETTAAKVEVESSEAPTPQPVTESEDSKAGAAPAADVDDLQLFQGLSISDAATTAPGPSVGDPSSSDAGPAGAAQQAPSAQVPESNMSSTAAGGGVMPTQTLQQQSSATSDSKASGALVSSQSVTKRSHEALVVREFLESNASQLTVYGITQIAASLGENALSVFFRNNHFNCLFKKGRSLYLLVTDQGYLGVPEVTWERLDTVDGDTQLCGPDFLPYKPVQQHSPPATRINMEALAAIPPEALAGLSEADAAAVAEAAGLLVPVPVSPATDSRSQGGRAPRTSQAGSVGSVQQPRQQHSLSGDMHDADLALAIQFQQEEHEAAARRDAARAQQQQHGHARQQHQDQRYYGQSQQQHGYSQQHGAYSAGSSPPGMRPGQPQPQRSQAGRPAAMAPAPPKKEESSCSIM